MHSSSGACSLHVGSYSNLLVRHIVTKWVYFFGAGKAEGDGSWRALLGGKGANWRR